MINSKNPNDTKELNTQEELKNIELFISIQNVKKENLLNCLNHINISIQDMDNIEILNISVQLLRDMKSCLDNIRESLAGLEKLKNLLEQISNNIDVIYNTNEYNNTFNITFGKIYTDSIQIENFLSQYIQNSAYVPLENIQKEENKNLETTNDEIHNNKTENKTPIEISDNTSTEILDNTLTEINNNTSITDNLLLRISEKENKVFLPYKINELQKKLSENKNYKSIQEIIDNEYIISLDKYKSPIISRFRESYNLMKNKERASLFDSLDLALELCFNSLLNPAVISACKNIDELDIYLDCLNSNELDKFKLFEIKYDLLPKKI